MKLLTTCVFLCQLANVGWSQFSVNFANRSGTTLRAPIYGVEPVCQFGNAPDGIPVGATVYSSTALAGTNYTAALFAGSGFSSPENLLPVAYATFGTGTSAGFFNGGMVPLPFLLPGSSVTVQVRVWANRGGSVTSWSAAQADPTIPKGASSAWSLTPAPGQTSANLTSLRSFSLCRADPHPRLSISRQPASGGISLSWPIDFDHFHAQSTPILADVISWNDLTDIPVTDGGRLRIDLPLSSSSTFFRLAAPQ